MNSFFLNLIRSRRPYLDNRTVVPQHNPPKANKDKAWDGSVAVKALRKWASSDGSGDKNKIDWGKYSKGFAWYDGEDKENFGSYKLPHHTIDDGTFKTVWHGVVAAMVAVNGGRGGVDIPESEKKRVYNHLANHYRQFDEEPPEYKG